MYDDYVKLQIEGLTRGRELNDAYILVLHKENDTKLFPVLIDRRGYSMVMTALKTRRYTCSHLMNKLASRMGMTMLGVRLMQPMNGHTKALIDFELVNEIVSISVSASEAVVAALETNSDLWIKRDLFEKQTAQQSTNGNMALPIIAMSNELLEQAMQSAVADDNFELASVLRDELNKRLPHDAN